MKRIWKVLLSILLVFALIIASLGTLLFFMTRETKDPIVDYETTNPYITERGKAFVSAHRSGGGQFPENTLMAFENCIKSKEFNTDIFEFDLHITKDGELILLHDSTLDRTTDSVEALGVEKAKPSDYTYDEIRKLNFGESFIDESGNKPYKGLRGDNIPENLKAVKLETVLDYLQANGDFSYIIEIKNSGELGEKAADKLYKILSEREMLPKAIIGTFHVNVSKYMDKAHPDMLRSCSLTEGIVFYMCAFFGIDKEVGSFNYKALQIPSSAFVINTGTTRVVNYAHKHNIAVQYWTVNDEKEMKYLNEIGADAIITDYPEKAYAVINSLDSGELV
ncbi:MAG TPA: glycerophosphodiester phosphodiesterase family protein [Oscillospiraceae bacterium]|nr:glycerophosphodiester phosphodiesterase family protein [Oscillospiraceae bacterium]